MGTYAYRSYIETLLNYDVSAKQSQFSSALYYKDTPGQMEKVGALPSSKTLNYKTPSADPNGPGTRRIRQTLRTWNQGMWVLRKGTSSSNMEIGSFYRDLFLLIYS